jgi:hypothetical protein
MQEFQIQSNIPVLILTIALIVIIVLGFLEFKKLSSRIDSISSNIESMKNNNDDNDIENDNSNGDDNGIDTDNVVFSEGYRGEVIEGVSMVKTTQQENQMKMNSNYEEDYELNNQESMRQREYIENDDKEDPNTRQLFITKGINQSDFNIEKENDDNENDNSDNSDSYSDTDSRSDGTSEYSDDSNKGGGIMNISEILNSNPEDINETETVEDLLNGVQGEELDKGLEDKSLEDKGLEDKGLEDDKPMIIDESMSVNELKEICKVKGLSVSGSKSKLISRIKENQ